MKEIIDVAELLKRDISIDVYDDVCEELAIAFEGPQELTEAGKKHFENVLDYEVELDEKDGSATLMIGNSKYWEKKLERAKELFYGMAGYCSEKDYNKWFVQ